MFDCCMTNSLSMESAPFDYHGNRLFLGLVTGRQMKFGVMRTEKLLTKLNAIVKTDKNMKNKIIKAIAIIVAALVPDLLARLFFSNSGIWIPVLFVFSLGAIIVFGMPIYFILKKYKLLNWWTSTLSGFVVGIIMTTLCTDGLDISFLLFNYFIGYAIFLSRLLEISIVLLALEGA